MLIQQKLTPPVLLFAVEKKRKGVFQPKLSPSQGKVTKNQNGFEWIVFFN